MGTTLLVSTPAEAGNGKVGIQTLVSVIDPLHSRGTFTLLPRFVISAKEQYLLMRIAKQTKMGQDYHVCLNLLWFQWCYSCQEKYRISSKRLFWIWKSWGGKNKENPRQYLKRHTEKSENNYKVDRSRETPKESSAWTRNEKALITGKRNKSTGFSATFRQRWGQVGGGRLKVAWVFWTWWLGTHVSCITQLVWMGGDVYTHTHLWNDSTYLTRLLWGIHEICTDVIYHPTRCDVITITIIQYYHNKQVA